MTGPVAAFATSHSPMLTATLRDRAENFGPRDETRAHVDRDGNPAT